MIKLYGPRVYLREHTRSDLDAFFDWISDEQVMEHLTWKISDRAAAAQKLDESIACANSPDRAKYFFAIVDKATEEMIGDVGLTVISRGQIGGIVDIGYFLRRKFFGKGYGLEASRLAVQYAFEQLKIHKVIASCAVENISSERLMMKLGMKKEGHFVSEYFHRGVWRDRVRYAILESEWKVLPRDE